MKKMFTLFFLITFSTVISHSLTPDQFKKLYELKKEDHDIQNCLRFSEMINEQIKDIKKTLEYLKTFDEQEVADEENGYKKALEAKEELRKPCDAVILHWLTRLEQEYTTI